MTILPTSVPASISSNILWVTEHQVSIGMVKKVTERWNVLIDLFESAKRSMDLDLSAREKIEGFGRILERAGYNVRMSKSQEASSVGHIPWRTTSQGKQRTRRSTRLFANSKTM